MPCRTRILSMSVRSVAPGRRRRPARAGADAGGAPGERDDRLHVADPRTSRTPLDVGGLGSAFPAALAAKLGRPDAPVVAINGDGGFLMNAQELETAVRHHINTVTVVMNNN